MVEENKAKKKSKVVVEQKERENASEISKITLWIHNFVTNFQLNKFVLRAFQRYLFTTGVILFLSFWLLVLLPIIIDDIYIEQKTIFDDLANIVGVLLIANVVFFTIVNVLNINIRSKTEQEEERVRRLESERVRAIDLRLNRLRVVNRAELSKEDDQNLATEFDALISERNVLTGKNPDSLDLIVFANWGRILMESRIRLQKEEKRLVARNVANLAYGISAAVIGAGFFMGAAVFSFYNGTLQAIAWDAIPLYYLLCVPITIISEVVAIFFLRLYSVSEQRIERNKNEITNIELRLTSGLMLYEQTNEDNLAILANTLSKEERNFVLGKNESSAGISADKLIEIITKAGATK